jgi:hypothetical protein
MGDADILFVLPEISVIFLEMSVDVVEVFEGVDVVDVFDVFDVVDVDVFVVELAAVEVPGVVPVELLVRTNGRTIANIITITIIIPPMI